MKVQESQNKVKNSAGRKPGDFSYSGQRICDQETWDRCRVDFAASLLKLRQKARIGMKYLAEDVKTHPMRFHALENGLKKSPPKIDYVAAIAEQLGVTVLDLIDPITQKEPALAPQARREAGV